jgi:hypothetical protein
LENAELHTRLAEVRDETDDLMKKYKALVQQVIYLAVSFSVETLHAEKERTERFLVVFRSNSANLSPSTEFCDLSPCMDICFVSGLFHRV